MSAHRNSADPTDPADCFDRGGTALRVMADGKDVCPTSRELHRCDLAHPTGCSGETTVIPFTFVSIRALAVLVTRTPASALDQEKRRFD
jgi:hypothetical protein